MVSSSPMESRPTRGSVAILPDDLRVHVAHDGELDEVVGVGVDVGADVEQERGGAAAVGRTVASAGRSTPGVAQDHLGGGHGSSGVAGGHKARGLSVAHQSKPDAQGRIALARAPPAPPSRACQ